MFVRFGLQIAGFIVGLWLLSRQPLYTDGLRWRPADSCSYELVGKLPFKQDKPFQIGDKLHRINYLPACSIATSLRNSETTLFLYEIIRQEEHYLLFAEFWPFPPLGWFQREFSLYLGTGILIVFLVSALLILRTILILRRYVRAERRLYGFLAWVLMVCILGMTWIYDTYYQEVSEWVSVIVGMLGLGWLFMGYEGGRLYFEQSSKTKESPLIWPRVGLFAPILSHEAVRWGIGIVAGLGGGILSWFWPLQARLGVGIILGVMGIGLPGVHTWVYGGLWLAWTLFYDPVWMLALLGAMMMGRLSPLLREAYHILTLRERYFYLASFIGGVLIAGGIGYIGTALGVWRHVVGSIVGGAAGWVMLEGLYLLYARRRRAQRRSLLEREIPLLWESPDIHSLERRVRALLKTHWDIEWAEIVRREGPQRLWLGRQSEAPPNPEWNKSEIEAAIPLGEPYWLLVGQVRSPLTVEDMVWLEHLSRYVGISRRHLELYEAAHEARLQALRHQLSPHFLFNALHTLQGLLYEDVALAEKLLSQLGQLLRRSLDMAKHLLIPLSEELALVRDYLEIEKQRYGSRLVVQWKVSAFPTEALIPPFTIQTLVENAIKHAVARQMRPTTIELCLSYQMEKVSLSVADDGPGFAASPPSPGIGLTNLRTRLEHIYGDAAQLVITSNGDRGTRVTITLPLYPLPLKGSLPDRNQSLGEAPS